MSDTCEKSSSNRRYHTFLPWTSSRRNYQPIAHMTPKNADNNKQTPPPTPRHLHHHHHQQHGPPSPTPPPTQASSDRPLLSLLRKNLLVLLLILALVLGVLLGVLLRLREEPYSPRELMHLRFPGELLMNMLKMLLLPMIVSNLVSGMTSLDTRSSGRMGCRAVTYYLTSMASAVLLGIGLVISIQPGKRGGQIRGDGDGDGGGSVGREFRKVHPVDSVLDLIRQMFPDNIVEATFRKTLTKLVEKSSSSQPQNAAVISSGNDTSEPELVPVLEKMDGVNMLGLVVFSLALGIAINHLGPRGLPLKALFQSLADVTMVLITVVIWYSPIGLLSLVVEEVVSMKNPGQTLEQLSFYLLTVVVGMAVQSFVTLPLLFFLVCRRNPYAFMYGVLQAVITALGTASSTATLPVTMRNLEENNGVDPRVVAFVVPVGTTVNMDGTALYEAVAAIFIAQVEGIHMDLGTVVIVCLTSMAAAVGGAGIPQTALVTLVMVLAAVGLPADRIGLVLAIDWLVDRLRTAVNVLGDAFGAGIVQHLSREDLARMDEEDKKAAAAAAAAAATAVATDTGTSQ